MAILDTESVRDLTYTEVIERAIASWLKEQQTPLATPMNPEITGDLSLRITRALVAAGLIEAE